MPSINKIAVAIIGLSLAGVASAAMYVPTPAACSATNATVGCAQQGWEFGIQALYAQINPLQDITATGDGFVGLSAPAPINNNESNLNSKWGWGYRIEGGYHFGTASDINLNWTSLHKSNDIQQHDSLNGLVANFIPLAKINVANLFENVVTSMDNQYDAVNLELGQRVDFGEHANVRFHGGVQFAQIKQTITQSAWESNPTNFFQNNIVDRFKGAGPRFGIDGEYLFHNGFSVVANTAVALLYGRTNYNSTENHFISIAGTEEIIQQLSENSVQQKIVPSVEAKLGAKYTHAMRKGALSVEGGYKVANYWGTFNNLLGPNSNNDFSFQGFYAGLTWVGLA